MSKNYLLPHRHDYPGRRSEVYARNVVATSQPLAAVAGLEAMRRGGNAVDAAIAAAITLTVVEPTMNGIGGDAFAIVHADGRLHGFNGSGRAPAAWSPQRFDGLGEMPETGWDSVTVPGAVDTWVQLSKRFGALPFAALFESAIHYARDGYAVSPVIQRQWSDGVAKFSSRDGFRDTFMVDGRAPEVGETVLLRDHADTLRAIAASNGEAFYRGDLAATIAADARRLGGAMTADDLAAHRGLWVYPISVPYRDLEVHEIPPNGQGLAALVALGILSHLEPGRFGPDSADAVHLGIEAMKLGFVDARHHIADPDHGTDPAPLLAPERLRGLAASISLERAAEVAGSIRADRGTVYLCSADAAGNMVSMIQSNFHGFGSGVVVPGTGIAMHNRGSGFVLTPDHPNQVGGGKRPFHTIIPGFLTRRGKALGPFGVMGGHMQPQGHVQAVCRLVDWKQPPQQVMDAPRWFVTRDFEVCLEPGFPAGLAAELADRGHRMVEPDSWTRWGGGQAILRRGDGYVAASDPRKDGCAVGF